MQSHPQDKILVGLVQQQHDLASRQYYVQVLQCAPVRSCTAQSLLEKAVAGLKSTKQC